MDGCLQDLRVERAFIFTSIFSITTIWIANFVKIQTQLHRDKISLDSDRKTKNVHIDHSCRYHSLPHKKMSTVIIRSIKIKQKSLRLKKNSYRPAVIAAIHNYQHNRKTN